MIVAYHGLGYVGLTGAVHYAQAPTVTEVIGYDPDTAVVNAINKGAPKAGEFLAYLGSDNPLPPKLWATDEFDDTLTANVHVIAVPSERNDRPYMAIVIDVVQRLLAVVPDQTTIIIESTLTPGTVDHILTSYRDRIDSGQVYLAVAPRRDWFADPAKNLGTIPRVVGGVNDTSTAVAAGCIAAVTPIPLILLTTYLEAELVKATENAIFHAPIMLLHELAMRYPHVNVVEVARLASTHWRFASLGQLYVGAGSGGRCVPLAPHYLLEGGSDLYTPPTMISAALNTERRASTVATHAIEDRARAKYGPQWTTVILGVAYRSGFKDAGMSPGLRLATHIKLVAGIPPTIHDPMWSAEELKKFGYEPTDISSLQQDVVVLATPHEQYKDVPVTSAFRGTQIILDVYGFWKEHRERFEQQGSTYIQVGTKGWLL